MNEERNGHKPRLVAFLNAIAGDNVEARIKKENAWGY